MNTQNLLDQYFETAFSAPDGIKRLRELILSLAMQGKLVPQDPNDQPARELLREIEAEKEQLIKSGKIKKQKPLPEIKPEEISYDLPESWEWVRLGESIIFTNGFAFKSNLFQDKGIGVIKIGDIVDGRIVKTKMSFVDVSILKEIDPKFHVYFNDLLIAMSGATTGKLGFNKDKETFLLNQRVGKIAPIQIDKYFLYHFLATQIQKNLAISSGSAIPNLSTEQIENILIPLPPLAEQKRIVEKIDRLMEQCDKLEKLRAEKEQKRILIHTAAREKLLTAKDQETFGQAWDFIKENFGELYTVKDNVTSLRQAILQLAVMGKLVPQDPGDRPASELLKEIEAEKQRLIKEGKIKKQKPLPEITADEIPYELPNNWKFIRLGKILTSIKYGTSKKCDPEIQGSPVLRIPNLDIEMGKVNFNNLKYTNLSCLEIEELALLPSDLLLIRSNGSESLVGRLAIIDEYFENLAYAGYLIRLRSLPNYIYSRYIYFFLNSAFARSQIEKPIRTTSGVKNINSKEISNLIISLPPLPEQHRIVAKVDALMALCDQLEQQIEQQTDKQTQLLESVMAGI